MLRRLLVYMRMLKIGALAYCCVGAGQVARLWLHPMDAAGTASPLKAADFADVDSKWLQQCQQKKFEIKIDVSQLFTNKKVLKI